MATRAKTTTTGTRPAKAAPAPARRTRNAQATRERILQVCLEVISQSGFRGMRVSEIAKGVGITEAGVLHHYPSKQALLDALLEYRERDSDVLQGAIGHLHGLEGLRALAKYGELIASNPARAQLLLVLKAENLGPEEFCGDHLRNRNETTRRGIVTRIHEAQELGEVRTDIDVDIIAREAQAFMDGINLAWLTDKQGWDLPAAWTQYIEALIARIAVPKKRP